MYGLIAPGVRAGSGRSEARAWVVKRARARVSRSDFTFVDSGLTGN